MSHEFYIKKQVEKETVHDADLELYAIQKARKSNWDTFKASKSFIQTFKKEKKFSSRGYNKLISRTTSAGKVCSLKGNLCKLSFEIELYLIT